MTDDRRSTLLARAALVLAALAYSSWVVEILTGSPLPVHRSFASELAALDRPAATTVRLMDAVSGALVLAALALGRRLVRSRRQRWIALGLLAFGVGTVADAAFPMSCAPSLEPGCEESAPGPLGLGMLPHELASGTAGVGIIVFTAAILFSAWRSRRPATRALVPLLALSLVVQLWLAMHSLAVTARPDVLEPAGWLQRAAIALTSVTLLALALGFTTPRADTGRPAA